mmetsp:Transcript_100149/g.180702  ORF Transcript_100149/g.180702 Transcript_100149/m.180702 type:complete len:262 (+) Transcript_100149:165-950(+)
MARPITHVRHPHCNSLAGEAAVAEGHDGHTSWLQYTVHLLEDLPGFIQVVHADDVSDEIKLIVSIRKLGLNVQVPHLKLGGLLVSSKLLLNHSCDRHALGAQVFREVADPGAADVKDAVLALRCLGKVQPVEAPDAGNCIVIDVCHESGLIIEPRVITLILSLEVCGRVRPSWRPAWRLQDLAHGTVGYGKGHLEALSLPTGHFQALHNISEANQLDFKRQRLPCHWRVCIQHGRAVGQNLFHSNWYLLRTLAEHHLLANL